MKGLIVYDSTYGNTKKIAETIAETLEESGLEVDIFHVKKVKKLDPIDYNFIVIGSPDQVWYYESYNEILSWKVEASRMGKQTFCNF